MKVKYNILVFIFLINLRDNFFKTIMIEVYWMIITYIAVK